MKVFVQYRVSSEPKQTIRIRAGATCLSVHGLPRHPILAVAALVDPAMPLIERTFWVIGTSDPVPPEALQGEYVGSASVLGEALWHVFAEDLTS